MCSYCWWRKSCEPVEVGSWNPLIYKVLAPPQVVVWDFWLPSTVARPSHPPHRDVGTWWPWNFQGWNTPQGHFSSQQSKMWMDVSQQKHQIVPFTKTKGKHMEKSSCKKLPSTYWFHLCGRVRHLAFFRLAHLTAVNLDKYMRGLSRAWNGKICKSDWKICSRPHTESIVLMSQPSKMDYLGRPHSETIWCLSSRTTFMLLRKKSCVYHFLLYPRRRPFCQWYIFELVSNI